MFLKGELKNYIDQECGLEPDKQRLLFEEMERDDQEYLDRVGVNDNAKVSLMEKKKTIERTFEEAEGSGLSSAAEVRTEKEVDYFYLGLFVSKWNILQCKFSM